MKSVSWRWVELLARLLAPDERETVLGDLAESGESASDGLCSVFGLVVRQEAELWRDWRPWLAAVGTALPFSFLLMGSSLHVSRNFQLVLHTATAASVAMNVALWFSSSVLLLTGCAWAGGFLVGSVSRRTLWVSTAMCLLPCWFCLARFRVEGLPRYCLLLFLLPAILGAVSGLRLTRMTFGWAVALAVGVTVLSISMWSSSFSWISTLVSCWPAWYLAATAQWHEANTVVA